MNEYKITGFVKDAEICTSISGVKITRSDSSGKVLERCVSSEKGHWKLQELYPDDIVIFKANGFMAKEFKGRVPRLVRLLNNCLIGYQEKLWFLPGEQVSVFAHSPASFSARLVRHGLTKEVIEELGQYDSQHQQVPDGKFVETGLEWNKSFEYSIPYSATPGLYSILLESNGCEPFAIPFIVSTPKGDYGKRSKCLVLASTNTWQSYNLWGGRSRYRNLEDGSVLDFRTQAQINRVNNPLLNKIKSCFPSAIKNLIKRVMGTSSPSTTWMHNKMTIRRPFTNCQLEGNTPFEPFTNHLGGGEWRVLAWLEREGIEFDIVSGAELHNSPELLQHYHAVVLSTHCEYWSKKMYDALKNFHQDNGLWIVNLSGNSIYREIDFFDDGSTRCVSLLFARSCADETQLIGVRFTGNDYATCAPYKVVDSDHWVFQGASINLLAPFFGGLSLNQNTKKRYSRYDPGRPGLPSGFRGMGASGWETDKLSKSTPGDFTLVAKGMNKDGGADMVVREPSGIRGGVFSASSVAFGGSLLIDDVCSTIVKNVLNCATNKAVLQKEQKG